MFETKDSGSRAEYASGMVRDTEEGKARFDLLLPKGIDYRDQMLTRFAELMARGAAKYNARNWELARGEEELERYHSSALRHLVQWATGETDEDHAAAVMFNLMAAETVKAKMRADASVRLANALAEAAEQGESMFSSRREVLEAEGLTGFPDAVEEDLDGSIAAWLDCSCRKCETDDFSPQPGMARDTVYIAGPMSGLPGYNYPAFNDAAKRFEDMGWRVFNPATNPHPDNLDQMDPDQARAHFMAVDIPMVLQSDAVAVLPGWENSKGATLEVAIGRMLQLRILDAVTMEEVR